MQTSAVVWKGCRNSTQRKIFRRTIHSK